MDHAACSKVLVSLLRLELEIDWTPSTNQTQQWNWQRGLEQNENYSITPETDAWKQALHNKKKVTERADRE